MKQTKIAIIGSGWAGASAARCLHDLGLTAEVFEKAAVPGGHSRAEIHNEVMYEPNGPHIFHTSDIQVARFVHRFGMTRCYAHCPLTEIFIDGESRLLSWPLQLEELRQLPWWQRIRRELEDRPQVPCDGNFESYCVSIMGETLYHLFVYHYTVKQWNIEPRCLGAHFAPKRIDLRDDGDRRLFRDVWQYFPAAGVNPVIESMLAPVSVHYHSDIDLGRVADELYREYDGVICTAPLDVFCAAEQPLPWRGIRSKVQFHESAAPDETATAGYTINRPHEAVAYTRSVETKHASGQMVQGTVVCEEYPNSSDRHYPVLTADGANPAHNQFLQEHIQRTSPVPVWFCGRLANYQYIDQDQAIRQGMDTAARVIEHFNGGNRQ